MSELYNVDDLGHRERILAKTEWAWSWYHDDSVYRLSTFDDSILLHRMVRTSRTGYRDAVIVCKQKHRSSLQAMTIAADLWRPDFSQVAAALNYEHETANRNHGRLHPLTSRAEKGHWFLFDEGRLVTIHWNDISWRGTCSVSIDLPNCHISPWHQIPPDQKEFCDKWFGWLKLEKSSSEIRYCVEMASHMELDTLKMMLRM